jgi:hypothetical protein
MDSFRFGKSVQSVVVASPEGETDAAPVIIYSRKNQKKKKGSPGLRLLGKGVRSAFDAQRDFGATYETAHDRSNVKKRDGWLRDLGSNLSKAGRKAMRKLMKAL